MSKPSQISTDVSTLEGCDLSPSVWFLRVRKSRSDSMKLNSSLSGVRPGSPPCCRVSPLPGWRSTVLIPRGCGYWYLFGGESWVGCRGAPVFPGPSAPPLPIRFPTCDLLMMREHLKSSSKSQLFRIERWQLGLLYPHSQCPCP